MGQVAQSWRCPDIHLKEPASPRLSVRSIISAVNADHRELANWTNVHDNG